MEQGKMPKEERDTKINNLLLIGALKKEIWQLPPLSPKEALFEVRGQNFLIKTGHVTLFAESKLLRHYPEVHASWQKAVATLSFGTPQLDTNSATEQQRLEFFFMELRHGDPTLAFSKYASPTRSRSGDEAFLDTVAKVLSARPIADNRQPTLSYYLVCGWQHSFFWGLSNEDRGLLLHRIYGVSDPISNKTISRTVSRVALKGWSDFRQTYARPPFVFKLFREGQQEIFQFLFYPLGHS